jgi:hypothetical protein
LFTELRMFLTPAVDGSIMSFTGSFTTNGSTCNGTFTGSAQILGQLPASSRHSQSNVWANLRQVGPALWISRDSSGGPMTYLRGGVDDRVRVRARAVVGARGDLADGR